MLKRKFNHHSHLTIVHSSYNHTKFTYYTITPLGEIDRMIEEDERIEREEEEKRREELKRQQEKDDEIEDTDTEEQTNVLGIITVNCEIAEFINFLI